MTVPFLKTPFPRRLGLQFGTMISLLLIATIGISTWLTAASQSAKLTDSIRGEAYVVARNIAALSANYLLVEDFASIETLLLRTAEFPNLSALSVTRVDGSVLNRVVKKDGVPVASYALLQLSPPAGGEGRVTVGNDSITVWQPVAEKKPFGWVNVEYSLAATVDVKYRIWRDAAVAGGALISVSAALILLFLNRHIRDVRTATAFARRLDERTGGQIPGTDSSTEMGQLIDAMNQASRRLAEQDRSIVESEQKYRTLFEESKDVVFISSPDGRVLDINPSGMELLGVSSREEALRVDLGRDMYADPVARDLFKQAMEQQGFIKDYEVSLRSRGGELVNVLITATAVRDEAGDITAYRGIMRDVTGQRKLEQQLRHAQKMEAVGQLTGGIAHDFNNILTAVIGYAYLLQSKMDAADPLRSYAAQILSTAERAAHLTQSLLAFSRKQVITLRPVALHEIVQGVEKLLLHLVGEDVDVTTHLSPDDLTVQADGGQIEQVLMNLAVNARDAMPHGGRLVIETRRVELDAAFRRAHGYGEPGSYGLIAVSDTGMGMDGQTLRRIFEPFFTTKEVGKGTGLGLSIVYGIVKQHNGYINVYSEPGRGTTFKIYLPLATVSAESALQDPSAFPRGGTETILVAEDDEAVRSLMRAVLGEAGYRLVEAVDGEDAVARFRENRDDIHLVILDVVMPKKNGREVFDAIRLLQPGITVLFTSGYASNIIHSRGVLEPDAPLLMKPVSPNHLLKTVRELLDRAA